MLLKYHIGRIVLGSMCVGVSVCLGWSGIRVAGFSLSFPLQFPSRASPCAITFRLESTNVANG